MLTNNTRNTKIKGGSNKIVCYEIIDLYFWLKKL